jgi:general stress protein 26
MTHTRTPVEQLNELIRGIQFAMLTTVRPSGALHSCPMATQEVDPEGHLWFFTRTDTEKVEALRSDRRACVAYADPDGQRYVSVTGIGDLIRSEPKARELWDPAYKAWFPQGLDDPNLVLIRVLVEDVEYWHAPEGRMLQLQGFARAALTGEEYQRAGHREIDFPENRRDRDR